MCKSGWQMQLGKLQGDDQTAELDILGNGQTGGGCDNKYFLYHNFPNQEMSNRFLARDFSYGIMQQGQKNWFHVKQSVLRVLFTTC